MNGLLIIVVGAVALFVASCSTLSPFQNAAASTVGSGLVAAAVAKKPELVPIFEAVAVKMRGGSPDFAVFDDVNRNIAATTLGNLTDLLGPNVDKSRIASTIELGLGLGAPVTVPPAELTPSEPNLSPLIPPAPTPLTLATPS